MRAYIGNLHRMLLEKILHTSFSEKSRYRSNADCKVPAVNERDQFQHVKDAHHTDIKFAISGNFRINFKE